MGMGSNVGGVMESGGVFEHESAREGSSDKQIREICSSQADSSVMGYLKDTDTSDLEEYAQRKEGGTTQRNGSHIFDSQNELGL